MSRNLRLYSASSLRVRKPARAVLETRSSRSSTVKSSRPLAPMYSSRIVCLKSAYDLDGEWSG